MNNNAVLIFKNVIRVSNSFQKKKKVSASILSLKSTSKRMKKLNGAVVKASDSY